MLPKVPPPKIHKKPKDVWERLFTFTFQSIKRICLIQLFAVGFSRAKRRLF